MKKKVYIQIKIVFSQIVGGTEIQMMDSLRGCAAVNVVFL